MNIDGQHRQSIWYEEAGDRVRIIDQTLLPHDLHLVTLDSLEAVCTAISAMQVRGAPLIGVTAAYGVYLALKEDPDKLQAAVERLRATRPTAVNLEWALRRCQSLLADVPEAERATQALALARQLEREDVQTCEAIGEHGAALLERLWRERLKGKGGERLNVLTHCNAGALAAVDWGTALAVVYKAADRGVPLHVWVDETRPRNQGASLTCWELQQRGIAHTLIVDNAGGQLMRDGRVDLCVVGSDRTAANGDVCNKIGTYLKALAAADNGLPFYVALPVSTIDFRLGEGAEIPIEERAPDEITHIWGAGAQGSAMQLRLTGSGVQACNPGFDITPARLVTGLITEHGLIEANARALRSLRAGLGGEDSASAQG